MKIQNNFTKGIVVKDYDERFMETGVLADAMNFIVHNTADQGAGVGKNVPGNEKRTDYGIAGGVSYGVGADPANNKLYLAVKGTDFDHLLEYDTITRTTDTLLQSTAGGALNFRDGEKILNFDIITDPEGNGNLLAFSGDSNPPRIINIERAKTWAVDGFTAAEIMLCKAPPLYPITLTGTNSSENAESNNLENRFPVFAYRYRYRDGYFSCPSTWTRPFFEPGPFDLDFETFENRGMLNIRNAVSLSFNTGPREVIGIDLLYRLTNSTSIYVIDKFIKEEQGWADDTTQNFEFNNSKVYTQLPEAEYFHSYDNVPHQAVAQTTAGNRIMFGNYLEQYDLADKNGDRVIPDYTLELVSNPIDSQDLSMDSSYVDYDFGTPYQSQDGLMIVRFVDGNADPIAFAQGGIIYINFDIRAYQREEIPPVLPATEPTIEITSEVGFTGRFSFVIDAQYDSLTDLVASDAFQNAMASQFMAYFLANGGEVHPDDWVSTEVLQPFEAFVMADTFLLIKLPVLKYTLDAGEQYDYFEENDSSANYRSVAVATSLKSRRSYEVCMIYRDAQARKTTALTSKENTLFIPNANAVTQNRIKVILPEGKLAPDWADTYKFGIKCNKGAYEEITASVFFVDGVYRWVKLDGENKNKVNEGDILTVKKDSSGALSQVVKVKVLEIKNHEKDFIEDNQDDNGQDIIEPAGRYMKIKQGDFDIDYDADEFLRYRDSGISPSGGGFAIADLGGLWVDEGSGLVERPLAQGSIITLNFKHYSGAVRYTATKTVNNNYASFEDWFQAELPTPVMEDGNLTTTLSPTNYGGDDQDFKCWFITKDDGNRYLRVRGLYGNQARSTITCDLGIRSVDGYFIFETEPIEIDNGIFYETPEVYTVNADGTHQMNEHLLAEAFNCYAFGNGSEAYQIRGAFNEKYLSMDASPIGVSENEFRQVRRYADITYSDIYDSTTNVNKLSEFNLYLANFKDDMEKRYGPIQKLRGVDTDLQVSQQDRDSQVFYGKDLLSNADGSTALIGVPQILGKQDVYAGEYGISSHPKSYDFYGLNSYHTDVKRGVVTKLSNNGHFEISSQGLKHHFKQLFKNTIIDILGAYDQYNDLYWLNVKYLDGNDMPQFETWVYSDKDNGFLTRVSMDPEDMIRVNSQFFSIKNGEVWEHQSEVYNSFFGVSSDSEFSFVFSQSPSERKNFKTLEIEGTTPLQVQAVTDYDTGYVNAADFEKKEGVYYAYIRTSNSAIDTALLATQGIGEVNVVNGNALVFTFDLPESLSVGDVIYNLNLEAVGTVLSKTARTITLDTTNDVLAGYFVMSAKPQSAEQGNLLGYYMKVTASFSSSGAQEIYAINSNCVKSYA